MRGTLDQFLRLTELTAIVTALNQLIKSTSNQVEADHENLIKGTFQYRLLARSGADNRLNQWKLSK